MWNTLALATIIIKTKQKQILGEVKYDPTCLNHYIPLIFEEPKVSKRAKAQQGIVAEML